MESFKSFVRESADVKGVSAKAQKAETDAYKKVGALLKKGKSLVAPAGFDQGFPDFAFRTTLDNGRVVDIHFEYKANNKAQMGSMRDWKFDGRKFYTPAMNNESKEELIYMMNNTPEAIKNGKRLLDDLKKHFHKDVKELFSGSLSFVKNQADRRLGLEQFAANTKNYTVATVQDDSLGRKIIDHYKKKFKANLESGSDASILLMMLDDTVWIVDTNGRISDAEQNEVAAQLGLKSFAKLNGLKARLECRIQPRGLNSPGKAVSIDVMANFRLAGPPPIAGGKII